ncbi:MAG: signal peptidase II [Desulfobacteraceae bacterium]|nr:signal peptidase II [Desulfobacteraceae bacterium]MBC2756928.1 signal peptidase II [Desulfobacteraceae bacterium]
MNALKNKYMMLVTISGLVVVLDQLTKWLITSSLSYYEVVKVIPGFFNLIYIHNPGGAFGILAKNQSNLQSMLFIIIAVAAMGLILYLYKNTPSEYPVLSVGFALIFGGALGNMIDRIRLGEVIDFVDLYIAHLHWPAFKTRTF